MKQKRQGISLSLTILSIILLISITIGSIFLQPTSKNFMTDTLKKASLTFAGARAINALVSVAQKIETGGSVKLLGTGGSASLAPFEWLDPLNDLVERFSLVMLTCCVAMGILLFLNQVMPWLGLAVLLPLAIMLLLLSLGLRWHRPSGALRLFRAGYKLLAVTAVAAVMVPVMAGVNFLAYSLFLEPTYESAALSMDSTRDTLSAIKPEGGIMETVDRFQQQVSRIKIKIEEVINHILDLIIVFLIQTIFLPLLTFWLVIKLISYIAAAKTPLPAESFFAGPASFQDCD
jgi:hypothetical protein